MSFVINLIGAGASGVRPQRFSLITTDSFSTITTAGYLNSLKNSGIGVYNGDFVIANYGTDSSEAAEFTISITAAGVYSLVAAASDVVLPTTAGHFAVYANSSGTITQDVATAINVGVIQAGKNGSPGSFVSYPATEDKGYFQFAATAHSGDFAGALTNAPFGQESIVSIPDPGAATANVLLAPAALVNGNLVKANGTEGLIADAGARIIANTTDTYAGGGTSNAFTATGLTSAAVGSAVIRTSTNAVSIAKAVPGTNTLTITFSADPGAGTTVDYIYVTASQA